MKATIEVKDNVIFRHFSGEVYDATLHHEKGNLNILLFALLTGTLVPIHFRMPPFFLCTLQEQKGTFFVRVDPGTGLHFFSL